MEVHLAEPRALFLEELALQVASGSLELWLGVLAHQAANHRASELLMQVSGARIIVAYHAA
eukprot:8066235-Alexandrium_andersonii.AAC.1